MQAYLDNAATTKLSKEALEAMLPYLTEKYGNASSLHSLGREAAEAIGRARHTTASFLGVGDDEIIFTSGGSEADNMALKGAVSAGDHIITSKIEHDAILKACKALEKQGVEVTYLNVDREGFVNPADVEKAIKKNTKIVSIMHANNEIGTIQDIVAIGRICRQKGVLFHTDAVQSFCKVPIDLTTVDMASFSGHKIHGPKGAGALFVRRGVKLQPLIDGGGHESGRRSGTENVAGIVGFAAAVKMISPHVERLRDMLIDGVLKAIPDAKLNGSRTKRLPNNANFSFKGIDGESLVLKLDEKGIMASTGSACSTKSLEPSHVLMAIGLSRVEAHGSLRVTLSSFTTEEEIRYVVNTLPKVVGELSKVKI